MFRFHTVTVWSLKVAPTAFFVHGVGVMMSSLCVVEDMPGSLINALFQVD